MSDTKTDETGWRVCCHQTTKILHASLSISTISFYYFSFFRLRTECNSRLLGNFSIISNFMLMSSSQSSVNLVSWSTKLPWKIKLWTIDSFLCFWVYFELFRRQQCCRQSNCMFWGCFCWVFRMLCTIIYNWAIFFLQPVICVLIYGIFNCGWIWNSIIGSKNQGFN